MSVSHTIARLTPVKPQNSTDKLHIQLLVNPSKRKLHNIKK